MLSPVLESVSYHGTVCAGSDKLKVRSNPASSVHGMVLAPGVLRLDRITFEDRGRKKLEGWQVHGNQGVTLR